MLGASRICVPAIFLAATQVAGIRVESVAARDPKRAAAIGRRFGVRRVHASYEALTADPDIEAVYVGLPNSCHASHSIRALLAGKHVLVEKPAASNADEAAAMVEVAAQQGRALVEAFHWRYHPLAREVILAAKEVGPIRWVRARFEVAIVRPTDIRWSYRLSGGALMDLGCYCLSFLRHVLQKPLEVRSARARSLLDVDASLSARLGFDDGEAEVSCSMVPIRGLRIEAELRGDRGRVLVVNPFAPHSFHKLVVTSGGRERVEHFRSETTYVHQLRAFADRARGGAPLPTEGRELVENMRLIDEVYRSAGLPRRGEG